jgi:hypothetical protein
MPDNIKKKEKRKRAQKAQATTAILGILVFILLITLLITSYDDIQAIFVQEPEHKTAHYCLYCCGGCCTEEKSVVDLIDDGWVVTNIYWDSCGNISVELEK